MSYYTRSIRGIEPTASYIKTQPINRYSAYRLTAFDKENVPLGSNRTYLDNQAAEGAASWLREVQGAQQELHAILTELGRNSEILDENKRMARLNQLTDVLNSLQQTYRNHEDALKREVWEAIELSLRHPATEAFGISKGPNGEFSLNPNENESTGKQNHANARSGNFEAAAAASGAALSPAATESQQQLTTKRLLLGGDGLLQNLKRALDYSQQRTPIDLLRMPFTSAYPYALYYGAMQMYAPLPLRGAIFNRYV